MKPILIALIAGFATLAAAPALADRQGHGQGQGRGASACAPGHGGCRGANPGHGPNDIRHGGRHLRGHDHDDGDTTIILRIGGDGRYGNRWDYRHGYGIQPAPYGQEYRIINNQLVLVDSQTLQIVAILGLLTALLN